MRPVEANNIAGPIQHGGAPRRGWIFVFALLLLVGVGLLHLYWVKECYEPSRLVALLVLAILCLSPSARQLLQAGMDWLNRPSGWRRFAVFAVIVAGAGIYLYQTALYHAADMNAPSIQDEFVYLIQTQMLARGRLWMPRIPLGDFFHSYFMFVTPVYAAKYTPGNAMLQTPMVWLSLPIWVMPLLLSSLCVGAVYLLFAELVDGVGGVLAALLLLGATQFRVSSALVMPYVPAVLFISLMLWAGVKWHKYQRFGWAAAIGFFSSMALLIRPGESLCFILPLGATMFVDLVGRKNLRHAVGTIGLIFLTASPLLAVQVISNVGITGHWYQVPYDYHLKMYHPAQRLGFHEYHPRPRLLEQMADADLAWASDLRAHTPENMPGIWIRGRFRVISDNLICDGLLLLILPLGLMGLRGKQRRYRIAVFCGLLLFVLLYTFYPFFLASYSLPILPAVLLLLVLGVAALERMGATIGLMRFLPTMLVATIAITSLPQLNHKNWGYYFIADQVRHIEAVLAQKVQAPAVVLFRYRSHSIASAGQEPVYNTDVAWPDDAPIIRAHDLGARDVELYRYYGRIDPSRRIYLYNRSDGTLSYLGTAAQLAAHPPASLP